MPVPVGKQTPHGQLLSLSVSGTGSVLNRPFTQTELIFDPATREIIIVVMG